VRLVGRGEICFFWGGVFFQSGLYATLVSQVFERFVHDSEICARLHWRTQDFTTESVQLFSKRGRAMWSVGKKSPCSVQVDSDIKEAEVPQWCPRF